MKQKLLVLLLLNLLLELSLKQVDHLYFRNLSQVLGVKFFTVNVSPSSIDVPLYNILRCFLLLQFLKPVVVLHYEQLPF